MSFIGWKVGERRHGEVTLRELQLGDFLEAKKAGLRRAKLASDGKTSIPVPAAMGIEMLRQHIVELDGEPVEVAEELPEEVSMTDFMALLSAFDTEDQATQEAFYEALVNPHGPKGFPTIH